MSIGPARSRRSALAFVAALSFVVPGAEQAGVAARAAPESLAGENRPGSPAEVWGACGWRTDDNKVVRTFARQRGDAGMGFVLRGGTSQLLCGNEDYGYRHILKRHRGEWETDARIGGTNWRDHADWS